MTNLETISQYEKLHDLFETVHPRDVPAKVEKLIKYLSEGSEYAEHETGEEIDVLDVIGTLEELNLAFTKSLCRDNRSMLLSHQERKYEINVYPIMNFLKDNPCISGDLDDLKARMVTLANQKNLGLFKQSYTFVDQLSIVLSI
jgi:hypothetical protein